MISLFRFPKKGEIDCWPVQCPTKLCGQYIQEPGDCCPRCVDENPCSNLNHEVGGADMSAYVCYYKGTTKHHGDSWRLNTDPCTTCECKVSTYNSALTCLHNVILNSINVNAYFFIYGWQLLRENRDEYFRG